MIYNLNISAGRKTPPMVNVPTNNSMNYGINDELTTDENLNAHESANKKQDLKDVIKYFRLSKYILSNIPSRLEVEYKSNLDDQKYRILFENTMEKMYCIMMNVKTGFSEKRFVNVILRKTMEK